MRTHWLEKVHTKWTSTLVATTALAVLAPLTTFANGLYQDFDARQGAVDPSATQLGMVSGLGANASWNKLGTPSSLIKYGDYLATGLNGPDATTVARNWIDANKTLFRLSSVDNLKVMSDEAFPFSEAYAVTFRQEIAGLRTAEDGLLTVGITGNAGDGWKVAYVSATTTSDASINGSIAMTAADAYVIAAQDIGSTVHVSNIVTTKVDGEWTTFNIDGFTELQRVRMRALPTPSNGIRPVYETIYLENATTNPRAYVHYIDAEDGTVWMRKDIVEQSHPTADTYSGTLPATDGACESNGPWTIDAGETVGSIAASVAPTLLVNDSVINLLRDGAIVASQDTGTSPEVVAYSPAGGVPAGDYTVEVCDYVDGAGWSINNDYTGQIVFSEAGAPAAGLPYPPKWNVFPANPVYGSSTDTRDLWCWENLGDSSCVIELINTASRSPWDYSVSADFPTFTTIGNNAQAAEAWVSPLTPGGSFHRPIAYDRVYNPAWNNEWAESKCFAPFVAGESHDISAAVTNLFAMHNRMHDFSYELGFTERRWNAQEDNFGNSGPGTLDGDPVIGNAQAGALGGGAPSYLGRDNANMITLQDGIPPITNMYLWQPLAGAFYAPCADGDYDMAIIGHEYGHMIENRMIGKGDGRSGHHAGAMGESFGDLVGMEILNEYDFAGASGENVFSVGGFATGNGERAIRNYNMSYPRTGAFPEPGLSTTGSGAWTGTPVNPLNFSNMGYDLTGPQVHADGEIWSAANFTIREYLTDKYEATHPYADVALQKACADGSYNPANCPGNRRWMQIVFDAMLLMPTAPSMLEARDAYLAADMMRFGGANQAELWLAFAHRGMGINASSDNTIGDPIADFEALLADNATVTFEIVDEADMPIAANVFVGHFENGTTQIADTNGNTSGAINLDNEAGFAPGDYEFVARADGFGHFRFAQTFAAGETKTIKVKMPRNFASSGSGGQIVAGSSDGEVASLTDLIDDTESTDWDKTADGVAIDDAILGHPSVTVDLGGMSAVSINRVQVSAMIVGHNRFTALRKFKVQTAVNPMSELDFSDWITSGDDAFPGHNPRPVSPEMILRSFDGPEVMATHVRIVALENQCTGNTAFQDPSPLDPSEDHDLDPANPTDCRDTSITGETLPIFGDPSQVLAPRHDEVHIAELQVFGDTGEVVCTVGCNNPVNQDPIAQDDAATTLEDTPVVVDVLADNGNGADTDPDGDPLTVTAVSTPANGTAANNGDGTVTYTPNTGFVGVDTFTYTVSDGNGGTGTATVTVTVNADGTGGGDNDCADDTDSDYHDCRVKGEGEINDGSSDEVKFKIETKQKYGEVDGKLYLDTEGPYRKVRGTPNAQTIDGANAEVTGTCEYEFGDDDSSSDDDKVDCTFKVNVTDPDQFSIEIYDLSGSLLYSAGGTVFKGDVEVTDDD